MLMLSRRQREAVTLRLPDGSEIRVVVERIFPGRVALGFVADRSVQIYRDELLPIEEPRKEEPPC